MITFARCRRCREDKVISDFCNDEMLCRKCSEEMAAGRELPNEFVDVEILVKRHRKQLMGAQREGRLHPDIAAVMGLDTGQYLCPVCELRHWDQDDAVQCCARLPVRKESQIGVLKW
jgi:hypothetical protein